MDNELKDFMEKSLLYHRKKCGEAYKHYQNTGKYSYYQKMVEHSNYYEALKLALEAANPASVQHKVFNRQLSGLKSAVDTIISTAAPREAIKKIRNEICEMSYYG